MISRKRFDKFIHRRLFSPNINVNIEDFKFSVHKISKTKGGENNLPSLHPRNYESFFSRFLLAFFSESSFSFPFAAPTSMGRDSLTKVFHSSIGIRISLDPLPKRVRNPTNSSPSSSVNRRIVRLIAAGTSNHSSSVSTFRALISTPWRVESAPSQSSRGTVNDPFPRASAPEEVWNFKTVRVSVSAT